MANSFACRSATGAGNQLACARIAKGRCPPRTTTLWCSILSRPDFRRIATVFRPRLKAKPTITQATLHTLTLRSNNSPHRLDLSFTHTLAPFRGEVRTTHPALAFAFKKVLTTGQHKSAKMLIGPPETAQITGQFGGFCNLWGSGYRTMLLKISNFDVFCANLEQVGVVSG